MFLIKSTILSQNYCFRWLQLCVKLFPASVQTIMKKSLFISVTSDLYGKYVITNNFCVPTHNSYCSLENCKFNILLVGSSFDKNLKQLDILFFTCHVIDCLYTLYKYRFFSNVISSTCEVFNQLTAMFMNECSCQLTANLKWKGA